MLGPLGAGHTCARHRARPFSQSRPQLPSLALQNSECLQLHQRALGPDTARPLAQVHCRIETSALHPNAGSLSHVTENN